MGTIKATKPPFTVITSNQERFLGYPLRRRAIYLQIEHPTVQVEAAIVARKTPELSHELHCFIAGLVKRSARIRWTSRHRSQRLSTLQERWPSR